MIKSAVISSLAISVLFAGLADDIKSDVTQQSVSNDLLIFRVESIKQCCNTAYIDYTGGKQCQDLVQYDSKKLDTLYTAASTALAELTTINEAYKEKLTNFINFQKNQNDNTKVFDELKRSGIAEVRKDGQVRMNLPCARAIENTSNIEKYKNRIKEEYKRVQILEAKRLDEEYHRIAREKLVDEKNIKVKQLKEIFEKELCQNPEARGLYSVARYDECINGAEQTWKKIDGLKKELTEYQKSIDSHQTFKEISSVESLEDGYAKASTGSEFRTYDEYLKALQKNRDYTIKEIQNTDVYNKKKNALIPEYKKWKKTIPAFQASLRPGTLVVGGIVTLVRDNLVEIDTGKRFIRQTRQQTLPRVPQDLLPLYYDEIQGLKEY